MIFRISTDNDTHQKPAIDAREIPAFGFEQPSMAGALGAAAVDFGILALMNILFFAGAFVSFLRYDVR